MQPSPLLYSHPRYAHLLLSHHQKAKRQEHIQLSNREHVRQELAEQATQEGTE